MIKLVCSQHKQPSVFLDATSSMSMFGVLKNSQTKCDIAVQS